MQSPIYINSFSSLPEKTSYRPWKHQTENSSFYESKSLSVESEKCPPMNRTEVASTWNTLLNVDIIYDLK